jgi:hypothetical protein
MSVKIILDKNFDNYRKKKKIGKCSPWVKTATRGRQIEPNAIKAPAMWEDSFVVNVHFA